MKADLLDCDDDGWVFQEVHEYVQDLLGENWHPISNVELLKNAPQSIKNIYYLWQFSAEVGGNGLYNYIVNDYECYSNEEWLATHQAMLAIKDINLAQRFESAVLLGFDIDDIALVHDKNKFSHFKIHSEFNHLDKLDKDIYQIVNTPLETKAAQYIRNHSAEIFDLP